jgi:hypothetical protein
METDNNKREFYEACCGEYLPELRDAGQEWLARNDDKHEED